MFNTIIEAIQYYAKMTPDTLAVVDNDTTLTYEAYWNKIKKTASFLKSIDVAYREYIVVKNTQDTSFLVLVHAIQLVGGIVVPLEKSVHKGRIDEIMKETGAIKFFGDIVLDEYHCFTLEDVHLFNGELVELSLPIKNEDSMILFTTGTTGKSKGIVLDYQGEVEVGINIIKGVAMKKGNIELNPMPLNHSFGLRRYFANMVNGSTVIIQDGVFFVKLVFDMIRKYQVTSIAIAPGAMNIILKLTRDKLNEFNDQFDYIQFGSAPILESDKQQLLKILPNVRLYNFYGSTEVGCVSALDFNSKYNEQGCIGFPVHKAHFKIIDFDGKEMFNASLNNPGLITYTGSMIMKGYYKEKELTNKSLVNNYLQTSDLGYIDDEGKIFMLGRADDVIITGGNKVSPLEVEEVANHVEGIVECICKGQDDPIIGSVPVLYIVVGQGYDKVILEKEFLSKLEDFKRPRKIYEIDQVPKTYNGKIDRKVNLNER